MRWPVRGGQPFPARWQVLLAAGAVLFALTAATWAPRPPEEVFDLRHRLVVNAAQNGISTQPGTITLADALIRASADPAPNLITFDPALFAEAPAVIRLTQAITLPGSTGGQDRIDGEGLAEGLVLDLSACPDAGISLGGRQRLVLARLTLSGGGQRGILLKDDASLTLDQVIVRNSSGPGAALFGQAKLKAARCQFLSNATHGIELHGESTATLESVVMASNGQSGMTGFDQSAATLRECQLTENGEWNVILTHSARADLRGCALRGGRFAGIDLSESARLRAEASSVDSSRRFGLFATGDASVELIRMRLVGSAGRGIELQDRARLAVEDSAVERSGDYGVILFGQSSVRALRSVFSHSAAHGVSLRGPSTGSFDRCEFSSNRFSGVGCLDGQDGGKVLVTRSLFHENGMRPIYRGPLHIDPMVPTPLRIGEDQVECLADPGATIELFLDRVGEAAQYVRTLQADARGRFKIPYRDVPSGWVLTASATTAGSTSEFNVVAGRPSDAVMAAILGRTGPLSDDGGGTNWDSLLRRWRPGTRVIFALEQAPSVAVERYVRFLVERIPDWTGGAVTAQVRIGAPPSVDTRTVVVPIRYLSPAAPQLVNRGGVTLMKWDGQGYFQTPMEIVLALAADPADTCPRVLAHEVGHALGLCHTRVGLLSRMQGTNPPTEAFLNDFSPMMTFYDVLALQSLHRPETVAGTTLRELVAGRGLTRPSAPALADGSHAAAQPAFSPTAKELRPPRARQ